MNEQINSHILSYLNEQINDFIFTDHLSIFYPHFGMANPPILNIESIVNRIQRLSDKH